MNYIYDSNCNVCCAAAVKSTVAQPLPHMLGHHDQSTILEYQANVTAYGSSQSTGV